MMTDPEFSIITVTLNNLVGLQNTWKSLRKQDECDAEWIVIDGGSTDGTQNFLEKSDASWISEKDAGIYDAMNKGLERAKGKYVIFLNAGDRLANQHTLTMLKATAQSKPDFIYGDSYEGTENTLNYKPARAHDKIANGMFTHHQAMVYKRETIGNLRYNTNYKIAADYDFTTRFLKKTKNILYTPLPLCIFESGGVSQKNAGLGRREEFKIRRDLHDVLLEDAVFAYVRQSLAWNVKWLKPDLYWALKSSRNNAPAKGQNPNPLTRPQNQASKHKNAKTPKAV